MNVFVVFGMSSNCLFRVTFQISSSMQPRRWPRDQHKTWLRETCWGLWIAVNLTTIVLV